MSQVVRNVGAMAFTANGNINTKKIGANADNGTVRLVLSNVEYVWGPNESKTLADNLADEAVAADSRLRIADSRDGFRGTART